MEINVLKTLLILHFYTFIFNFDVSLSINSNNYFVYNSSQLNNVFDYEINNENKCDCSVNYMYNLQKNENDTFFKINLSDEEILFFNKNNLQITTDNPNLLNINYDVNEINIKFYTLSVIQKCNENNSELNKNWALISATYENKTIFSYLKYCDINKNNELISKLGLYISFLSIFINAIYYEWLTTKTEVKVVNSNTNIDDGEININSVFYVILLGSLTLLILYYFKGKFFLNFYTLLIIQQIFLSISIKLEEIYENSDLFKTQKFSFLSKKLLSRFSLQIYQIIINIISLSITIIYWFTKHWIINNVLVGFLSYSIISVYHIKNFKICLIFLFVTLLYDVFWVYISPFFFKGENIMVYAASKINLPIKLQIPKFLNEKHPLNNCIVLGLGDIAIPGFIIKFLKRFDFLKNTKCYYKLGIIMYSIALFTSALINFIFNYPQPVLLYMCPFLGISTLILAYKRNEINDILYSEKVEEEFLKQYQISQEKIKLKVFEEEKEINIETLNDTLKSPSSQKSDDIPLDEDDIINIDDDEEINDDYEDDEDDSD